MMNESMNEYDLMKQFELRRDTLMEEARRERLKVSILSRARQSRQPGRLALAMTTLTKLVRARLIDFQSETLLEPPCAVDDCLETPVAS